MSVLVLEPQSHNRAALRAMLLNAGYGRVLEAADETEARALLKRHAARLDLILADINLATLHGLALVRALSTDQASLSAPFLILSSGISASVLKVLRLVHPRIDGHLKKPFSARRLREALIGAQQSRARARDTLLLWMNACPDSLSRALSRSFFKRTVLVTDAAQASQAWARERGRIGALIICPTVYARSMRSQRHDWLGRFGKNREAREIPIVCLGATTQAIPKNLRAQARLTLAPPLTDDPEALSRWRSCVHALERRILNACILREELARARRLLHQGELSPTRRLLKRLIARNPENHEAYCLLGDVLGRLGDPYAASALYRHAMETHPWAPHPYMRLLDMHLLDTHRLGTSQAASLIQTALRACPDHAGIRARASQAQNKLGLGQARAATPAHPGYSTHPARP